MSDYAARLAVAWLYVDLLLALPRLIREVLR